MTMRVTMLDSRMGETGTLLVSGSTYTVSDAFGAALVGARFATDTDNALRPANSEPVRAVTDASGNVTGLSVGGVSSITPLRQLSPTTRPTMLIVGNSLAGVNSRTVAVATATITTEIRPGANQITLAAGGVAAASLLVNDFISVSLCNQQPWIVKVIGIAGEVLTLENRTPVYIRINAGVQKVTSPSFWPTNYRGGLGWITIANALLGAPCHLLHGYGFGSGEGRAMITDLPALLRHYRPNFVYFVLFENDVANGVSFLDCKWVADTAARMCLNAGATPVFEQCLPSNSINTAGKSLVFDQLNAYLSSISQNIPGAYSINHGDLYLDTATPNSRAPQAGWTDGVHPSNPRHLPIGQYRLDVMKGIIGARSETASLLFGINKTLSGSGGTNSGLQGGSVVPANTTITAQAGVTCTTSKNAADQLVIDMTIPGASNISTTQLTITQSINLPVTTSANTLIKAVCRMRIDSMARVSMPQLQVTVGTISTDTRGSGDLTQTTFISGGQTFTQETVAIPVRDPAATTAVITMTFRPETLGSPSGVEFKGVIEEFGIEMASVGEVDWKY